RSPARRPTPWPPSSCTRSPPSGERSAGAVEAQERLDHGPVVILVRAQDQPTAHLHHHAEAAAQDLAAGPMAIHELDPEAHGPAAGHIAERAEDEVLELAPGLAQRRLDAGAADGLAAERQQLLRDVERIDGV